MKTRKVIYAPLQIYVYIISCYLLSSLAMPAEPSETSQPVLTADTNGILWAEEDENTVTAAMRLAYDSKGFVILVGTSKGHQEQALTFAKKLQKWFLDHPHMPDDIPIVAFNIKKQGVAYSFCLAHGSTYNHKKYATSGVLKAENTVKVLDDAVLSHRAAMVIREQGESYLD